MICSNLLVFLQLLYLAVIMYGKVKITPIFEDKLDKTS